MTPAFPKISVVTPSFNQAQFLEGAIFSVLSQDYPNLEYVIIDGGSSDGSREIIEKYSPRLHYWISEQDRGHGHALNKGFAHTSGEIMAWLNADDMYTPWAFRVVAEVFTAHPMVNWIVGFNAWWNDEGAMTGAERIPKNIYDFLLGNYAWIQQESVFWRRPLWERAGGRVDEDFRLMVDGELWSRFFLLDQLYAVDCILAGYRVHANNRAGRAYRECLKEMDRAIARMRRACPADVLSTGRALRAARMVERSPLSRVLPLSRLARRVLRGAFSRARYPMITYERGAWVRSSRDFSV